MKTPPSNTHELKPYRNQPFRPLNNHRCHTNCEYLREQYGYQVALCLCRYHTDKEWYLHCVLMTHDEKIIDPTLDANTNRYLFLAYVPHNGRVFNAFLAKVDELRQAVPWYKRPFFKI